MSADRKLDQARRRRMRYAERKLKEARQRLVRTERSILYWSRILAEEVDKPEDRAGAGEGLRQLLCAA